MLPELSYVTARKVETPTRPARVLRGRLVSSPVVGRGLVILSDPYGLRVTTSPVVRVLTDPDGKSLYVQTSNSVYLLTVRASRDAP